MTVNETLPPSDIPWRDRDSWSLLSLCLETDPDLFFPETGEHASDAIRVCNQCPVREQCLEFALDIEKTLPEKEIHGVFGGVHRRDRIKINKDRGVRNDATHYLERFKSKL